MGYWKSKVLPKIKKVFVKNGTKKTAAAEACKSFDDSKDEINKEFEEKKAELQTKVVGIYEASSVEIKTLVKEPKEDGLKKNSTAVNSFLEELVKIEFPGSKVVSEASSKYGAGLISGPVFFIFEKVSTFIVTEEKPAEAETKAEVEAEAKTVEAEASSKVDREIVVKEEKKEEAAAEKTEPASEPEAEAPPPPPTTEPAPPSVKEESPSEPPKP